MEKWTQRVVRRTRRKGESPTDRSIAILRDRRELLIDQQEEIVSPEDVSEVEERLTEQQKEQILEATGVKRELVDELGGYINALLLMDPGGTRRQKIIEGIGDWSLELVPPKDLLDFSEQE